MVIRIIKDFLERKKLETLRQQFLHEEGVQDFYDAELIDTSEEVERFYELQRTDSSWQKLFGILNRFCKAGAMLDVGCGGYELVSINNSEKAVGADISKAALQHLRRVGFKGQIVQADCLHLPFAKLAFETVISNQVIEHMPTMKRAEKFVSELERLSARVMVVTPNAVYSRKCRDPTHFLFFTSRSFKKITANFEMCCAIQPGNNTLEYYLLFRSPRLKRVPVVGKAVVYVLGRFDSSSFFAWLNRKLWRGVHLIAVKL